MTEKEIYILLHKQWTDSLSGGEEQRLTAWLAESPNNEALADNLHRAWTTHSDQNLDLSLNTEAAWHRFSNRIDIKSKSQKSSSRRFFMRWAAAAAVLLIVTIVFLFQEKDEPTWQSLYNDDVEVLRIELPDGSKVALNHNSEIRYRPDFTSSRTIELTGEAWFDVERAVTSPFVVNTQGMKVKVLGTSFNVRNYPDKENFEVYVIEGRVEVKIDKDSDSESYILEATDKLIHGDQSGKTRVTQDISNNATAWYTKKLSFRKTPLKEAIQDIERTYQVTIQVENNSLDNCPFTSPFVNQEIDQVLQSLCAAFNMSMTNNGDGQYTLKGGSCD